MTWLVVAIKFPMRWPNFGFAVFAGNGIRKFFRVIRMKEHLLETISDGNPPKLL
jgi:hypothetical protein